MTKFDTAVPFNIKVSILIIYAKYSFFSKVESIFEIIFWSAQIIKANLDYIYRCDNCRMLEESFVNFTKYKSINNVSLLLNTKHEKSDDWLYIFYKIIKNWKY